MCQLKTILLCTLLLTTLSHPGYGKALLSLSTNKDHWTQVKCQKGVTIHQRWVMVNNLKVRERKGEFVVDCNINKISNFLASPESLKYWMKGVTKIHSLKLINNNKWCVYSVFKLPWPIENRDMVAIYELNRSENLEWRILIQSIDSLMEEQNHLKRIQNFRASWLLTPIDEHKTKLVFRIVCATPPLFPRWIQDPILKGIFLNNLIRVKTKLAKLSEQDYPEGKPQKCSLGTKTTP